MTTEITPARVDRDDLRDGIQAKYTDVAEHPEGGFHFHTGYTLVNMLGYDPDAIAGLPQAAVESFAGTGNPLSMGRLPEGSVVADVGCGAGLDTLLAAQQVGPTGRVISVDMTAAMLAKTRAAAAALGLSNVETREGFAEKLPIESESVDVVISNGVLNLTPDKLAVLRELARILRPGGRLQIADMVVGIEVPQEAKDDIELWSG